MNYTWMMIENGSAESSPICELLGAGDPPPYDRINESGCAPILLICDHASNRVPRSLDNLGLPDAVLDQHVGWDIGAADVVRELSKHIDAMGVLANYSRLVVDNNRPPGDPSFIPAQSDGIVIPGNRELNEVDQNSRSEQIFWPYHDAISDGIARLWRRGKPPALISIHSFTPRMNGEGRVWQAGILWDRDPRVAKHLMDRLSAEDQELIIGDNEPYSGKQITYSLDFHAAAAGLPHCAVEIRQDLLATSQGILEWAERLAGVLSPILTDESLFQVAHF